MKHNNPIKMNLKVKLLNPNATLPNYAHTGDAGLDLFSAEETNITPGESALVKTGIAIELPPKTEAQIRPRSGLALNHQVTVLNSPGTIDVGFRGEIGVILINHGKKNFLVKKGMKIAQLVIKSILIVNVVQVNELTQSKRGENGFGSTGL